MSWQEELRKLDEELAAGRLSADDYRVRRDQVLSSAVTHGDEAAGAQAQAPGQAPAQPGQPQQTAQPGQPDPAQQQAAAQPPQAPQAPQQAQPPQPQSPQPQSPQAQSPQAQPQQGGQPPQGQAPQGQAAQGQAAQGQAAQGQAAQQPQPQNPQPQSSQQPQSQQQPPQNQGGDGNSTQVIAPVSPPPGQAGQPPAGPGQTPPQAAQPGGDPEATQAVRPSDPEATQAVRPGDAEATQAVQPVAPPQPPYQPQASPAAGFPQPQQPWNAPDVDQSPPWGGEFPPVSPGNSAEWGQGPEDSFDNESKGKKGKVFAIIAAVVLLAGIATGAFFLFGSGDGEPTAEGGNQGQQGGGGNSSSQAPEPKDDMPLDGQQGEVESSASLKSWDDIANINLLNDDELSAYQGTAPGEAEYAVYRHDGGKVKTVVLMVKVADQEAASAAVGELRDIQLKNGQKNTSINGVPGSVQVTEIKQKKDKGKITQNATMRAHYLAGDVLVRIEGVSGEAKLDKIRDKFEATLKTQLENLSADE
ncbi:hypothetical protein [Prauserella alba]|uniref:hypothetical protein n=1 Tax=Prauserella alba TaxID=176898 RepID=UPI0020A405E6|nr:hypothetical protein [Prauserella alba]